MGENLGKLAQEIDNLVDGFVSKAGTGEQQNKGPLYAIQGSFKKDINFLMEKLGDALSSGLLTNKEVNAYIKAKVQIYTKATATLKGNRYAVAAPLGFAPTVLGLGGTVISAIQKLKRELDKTAAVQISRNASAAATERYTEGDSSFGIQYDWPVPQMQ